MAAQKSDTVALLSIHPRYVEAILEGRKRVEFRRARFRSQPKYIVIYATQPTGKVVGFFEVGEIREGHPASLWRRYKNVGGINHGDYDSYYSGADRAVAIEIKRVFELPAHIPLKSLIPGATPPQSFRYLNPMIVQELEALT